MLTVLVRTWSGHERVVQAREVRSEPPSEFSPGRYRYFLDHEDRECEEINGDLTSTIYVMNDAGRTVATYHFSRGPQGGEAIRVA